MGAYKGHACNRCRAAGLSVGTCPGCQEINAEPDPAARLEILRKRMNAAGSAMRESITVAQATSVDGSIFGPSWPGPAGTH